MRRPHMPLLAVASRANQHPDTIMRKVRAGKFPAPIQVDGIPSHLVIFDEAEALAAIEADERARRERRSRRAAP